MIELGILAGGLVAAGMMIWGRDVQVVNAQNKRNSKYNPSRSRAMASIKEKGKMARTTPYGAAGTPEYRASALQAKCLELGLDVDQDLRPKHKVGPRLVTIAIGPGEEFDIKEFAPGLKTSNWQRICRDKRLGLNPETARCVNYLPENHQYTGIEYPRFNNPKEFEPVLFSDLLGSNELKGKAIPMIIGKTARGDDYIADLASSLNPHYLIGATTGGGKTELMRSMICSALAISQKNMPRIALIDVAKVGDEFDIFDGHKSLITPVITTSQKARGFLRWVVENELPRRGKDKDKTPLIIFFDEIADCFEDQKHGDAIQGYCENIVRIGRSLRVHLIAATQSLDAVVFSQQFRNNTPGRLCLRTMTKTQGNQIISDNNFNGSQLLGNGDLMTQELIRCQSAYVEQEYIDQLVSNNKSNEYSYEEGEVKEEVHTGKNKYYSQAVKIISKYKEEGINQTIMKKELNINNTQTINNLLTELEDNKMIGKAYSHGRRRRVLV